jgi:hypothetical protein
MTTHRVVPRKTGKIPPRPPPPSRRIYDGPTGAEGTIEAHATKLKVLQWKFEAAKVGNKWPQGAEISEEDFQAAIVAVANIQLR